jgi:hypothetical protein
MIAESMLIKLIHVSVIPIGISPLALFLQYG